MTRAAVGAVFVAWPAAAVRALGVDSATAARVGWLTRMFGVRDAALGVGAVAVSGRARAGWLLAGLGSDLVDAAGMVTAIRQRRVDRVRGGVFAAGAVGAAALGVVSLVQTLRRR